MTPVAWALAVAVVLVATLRPRRPVRTLTADGARASEPPPARSRPPTPQPTRRRQLRLGRRHPRSPTPLDLARWCEGVARSLRSGSSLGGAVGETGAPNGLESTCARWANSLGRGMPLRSVDPPPDPDVALVAGVLEACAADGGRAAEPLDRAASVLRGRATEADERRTQSAQARWSAVVMTILPLALLGILMVTSSSVRQVVATPAGTLTVALGGLLNVAGWQWLRRLIDRAAR